MFLKVKKALKLNLPNYAFDCRYVEYGVMEYLGMPVRVVFSYLQ